jgi:hypothetical protein
VNALRIPALLTPAASDCVALPTVEMAYEAGRSHASLTDREHLTQKPTLQSHSPRTVHHRVESLFTIAGIRM